MKDIIDSGRGDHTIRINHNDGKTYNFKFDVKVSPTMEYAKPKLEIKRLPNTDIQKINKGKINPSIKTNTSGLKKVNVK